MALKHAPAYLSPSVKIRYDVCNKQPPTNTIQSVTRDKTMHKANKIAITLLFSSLTLLGCSHNPFRPYRVNVQQGNILEPQTVQKLHLGMTKHEVEDLLGSPVLSNSFADNHWTYIYTNQINGGKIEKKQLLLYFVRDGLAKIMKNEQI